MRYLTLLILPLFLSACISQNQADIKMAKGCEAGINSLLEDQDLNIQEVKVRRYADEDVNEGLHRRITLEVVENDGWADIDKEYSCLFMQDWGLFKSSHNALLVQVKMDDTLIGKDKDGVIQGGFQEFLTLTQSVDNAMEQ